MAQLEESDGYGWCTCFCLGYHSTGASCLYGPTRDVELGPRQEPGSKTPFLIGA